MRRHAVSILRRVSFALFVACSVLLMGVAGVSADNSVDVLIHEEGHGCQTEASVVAVAAREAAADQQKATKDAYGDVTEEELKKTDEGPAKAAGDEYGNVTEAETAGERVEEPRVRDPLERYNRAMFKFNDKLYFWVLEPVTRGYKKAVPEDFRVLINNVYKNVLSPIRIVNSLLQFKVKEAGVDLTRFVVNSTVGVGGLRDVGSCMGLNEHDEDFGQTLGFYGVGPGFYVVWPVLGASTARDSVGLVGDYFLSPLVYVPFYPAVGIWMHDRVNALSFRLGDYEALKKAAVDPYIAVRSAYYQNRQAAIAK